ncbi:hypothetical protein [Marilutibacter chinensis]|uniref:Lipoprotein n=1 Tax=Marilutibacter chinensis TaxID=2912247 RepID=A0ABS9HRV1_9GAMM|nr:hypothetical protein [Lysobacter chinensis]MCF7221661.1 hypothetical protein [Lysobacter chinensis]
MSVTSHEDCGNAINSKGAGVMIKAGSLPLLLIGALVLSGCGVHRPAPYNLGVGMFSVDPEKEIEQMDALAKRLKNELAMGKSVVLSPIFSDAARSGGYRGKDGLNVLWENPSQEGGSYSLTWLGATQVRVNGRDYLVSVERPGRYSLKAVRYVARNASLDGMELAQEPVRSRGIGVVYLSNGTYAAHEWTQEWKDEISWNEYRLQTYCTPTVGGHCISSSAMEAQKRVARPAGYQPTVKEVDRPAVNASISLDRDFASFELRAGEVVLVDGVFARPPNVWFDDASCEAGAGDDVKCDLSGFAMQRIAASIDDLRAGLTEDMLGPNRRKRELNMSAPNYSVPSPRLAEVLSAASYREVSFAAVPGEIDDEWGQQYYLGKN